MIIPEEKKAGYITLKEAGERFGYSQDYLGQLIRKGKLEGKLVYSHVAWVTTPEAVEEYLAGGKKKKQDVLLDAESETFLPVIEEDVAFPSSADSAPAVPHEDLAPISRTSRLFLGSFRVLLLLVVLFCVYVFYLFMTVLGSALHTNKNIESASVIFSVPAVSAVSGVSLVSEHHAVALVSHHE